MERLETRKALVLGPARRQEEGLAAVEGADGPLVADGLNAELPASVEEMLRETQAMKREWEKRLAVPRAYVTYAALKSANAEAMRAALSATVIPDRLGKQGDLFDGS